MATKAWVEQAIGKVLKKYYSLYYLINDGITILKNSSSQMYIPIAKYTPSTYKETDTIGTLTPKNAPSNYRNPQYSITGPFKFRLKTSAYGSSTYLYWETEAQKSSSKSYTGRFKLDGKNTWTSWYSSNVTLYFYLSGYKAINFSVTIEFIKSVGVKEVVVKGVIIPDETTIHEDTGTKSLFKYDYSYGGEISAIKATTSSNGISKPDNSTITIDSNNILSATELSSNRSTLNLLSTSSSGKLLFNDNEIATTTISSDTNDDDITDLELENAINSTIAYLNDETYTEDTSYTINDEDINTAINETINELNN